MIDKKLERKMELLKEFIEEWVTFRDFLKGALKDETISDEKEKKFLEIKSCVARKYQMLIQVMGQDFSPEERLMDIISHAVSLESMAGTSGMQFRKMENDWHLSYINLNKLLGGLESEKESMARVSKAKVFLGHFAGGTKELCRGVGKILFVLIILTIIGVIGSYFLVGDKQEGLINYLATIISGMITGE